MLHMRSELNLGLKSTKLTCFLEGDRVGAIQDIIPSLQHKRKQKASGAWGDQHDFSSSMFLAPKPIHIKWLSLFNSFQPYPD